MVLRRVSMALLVAFTVSVIGFMLLRLSGDLVRSLAGEGASPGDIAATARLYGLDRSLAAQYFSWLGDFLTGDLGRSLFTGEDVLGMISTRIGVTVYLAFASLVFAMVVGIPLGVLAASRPNSWIDRLIGVVSVLGQGLPNFWLGLMLIIVFGVWWRVLPTAGDDTPAHFVLPVLTLGTSIMPQFVRLTRSGVLDALGADYIRAARAKGLPEWRVLFRHALPNAILPVVSIAAVTLGFLLGGSVIVESVFAINGIGLLAYESILRSDFPVVQAVVVIVSLAYTLLTLLSDLVNAWLDPRIRA